MNKHGQQTGGQGNWRDAIACGIVVSILTASLLSVAGSYFLPEIVDGPSSASNLFGLGVWLVAIALGGREVARRRPRG